MWWENATATKHVFNFFGVLNIKSRLLGIVCSLHYLSNAYIMHFWVMDERKNGKFRAKTKAVITMSRTCMYTPEENYQVWSLTTNQEYDLLKFLRQRLSWFWILDPKSLKLLQNMEFGTSNFKAELCLFNTQSILIKVNPVLPFLPVLEDNCAIMITPEHWFLIQTRYSPRGLLSARIFDLLTFSSS